MEPRGVFAECVHRIYLQDEADAVISALEAENERLRNDNAVLRDLAAAANPPKLSPEQLQRLRDLEQEKP